MTPRIVLDVEYLRDGAPQALDGGSGENGLRSCFLLVDAHLNAAIKGIQTKLTVLPLGVIHFLRNQIAQKWKATCQGLGGRATKQHQYGRHHQISGSLATKRPA